jgi:hypothetical protein
VLTYIIRLHDDYLSYTVDLCGLLRDAARSFSQTNVFASGLNVTVVLTVCVATLQIDAEWVADKHYEMGLLNAKVTYDAKYQNVQVRTMEKNTRKITTDHCVGFIDLRHRF